MWDQTLKMTRVQNCRALRRRGGDERGGKRRSRLRETRCVADTVDILQPCSLTDFACTIESFALAANLRACTFHRLILLCSACCLRRKHRYPHSPQPSSSGCSIAQPKSSEDGTRGISNLRLASYHCSIPSSGET